MRGTHGSTVRRASPRGSSGPLASLGRAHASRGCLIFYYNTNWWLYYVRGRPSRFFSSSGSVFPPAVSPSLTLPLLGPPLPPRGPGYPGLASLWRRRAPLRRGPGVAPGSRPDAVRGGTVAPPPGPGSGRIRSVGASPRERGRRLQSPSARPPPRRAGAGRDSAVRGRVLRSCE